MSMNRAHPRYKVIYKEVKNKCLEQNINWLDKPKQPLVFRVRSVLHFTCMVCDTKFSMDAQTFISHRRKGPRCPKCSKKFVHMIQMQNFDRTNLKPGNTLTDAEVRKRLLKRGYLLINPAKYTGGHALTVCRVEDPTNIRTTGLGNLLTYKHSKKELGLKKKTVKEYNEELKNLNARSIALDYKGAFVLVDHKCKKCGYIQKWRPTVYLRGIRHKFCSSCKPRHSNMIKIIKIHERKTGYIYVFHLRGYEPLTLKELIKEGNHPKNIKTDYDDGTPKIRGLFIHHRPDFYLPLTNTIIETKSFWTAGLLERSLAKSPTRAFNNLRLKAKTAIQLGYNYELRLYNNAAKPVKIPKLWYRKTREELRQLLGLS